MAPGRRTTIISIAAGFHIVFAVMFWTVASILLFSRNASVHIAADAPAAEVKVMNFLGRTEFWA